MLEYEFSETLKIWTEWYDPIAFSFHTGIFLDIHLSRDLVLKLKMYNMKPTTDERINTLEILSYHIDLSIIYTVVFLTHQLNIAK